jgi:2-polyprenyl-6-methoxyphenol hydroxylase-like FAD-dependent oxidoreductase
MDYADSLLHEIGTDFASRNGRTGEEVHRFERQGNPLRPTIRTQRTKLQSALLEHVAPGIIQLSKELVKIIDLDNQGVELHFADGTQERADLVVGADGIRSVGLWFFQSALSIGRNSAYIAFSYNVLI